MVIGVASALPAVIVIAIGTSLMVLLTAVMAVVKTTVALTVTAMVGGGVTTPTARVAVVVAPAALLVGPLNSMLVIVVREGRTDGAWGGVQRRKHCDSQGHTCG